MDPRFEHLTAVRVARRLVEIISPCLRPEERQDAFREFYDVVLADLQSYARAYRAEEANRRKPSRN